MLGEHPVEGGDEGDVGVGGGVHRHRDVLPLGLEELAAQGRLRVGEGDGVDDAVELLHPEAAQLLGQGGKLVVVGDVKLQHLRHRIELAHCATGDPDRPRQVGDDDPCTLLLGDLSHLERNRGVHRHAGDEDGASFKKPHGDVLPVDGDGCTWCQWPMPSPPSTGITAPEMYPAGSETRNRTAATTSSTVPNRLAGMRSR